MAWQTPAPVVLAIMVTAGLMALLGQLCLTQAYSLAPAARVGTITYVSVIFAAGIGWLIWDETPTTLAALGAVLVITACILASWQRKPRATA